MINNYEDDTKYVECDYCKKIINQQDAFYIVGMCAKDEKHFCSNCVDETKIEEFLEDL